MSFPFPDQTLLEFRAAVSGPDEEIDLARATLVIAKVDSPDLEIEPILDGFNALAARVVARAGPDAEVMRQIEALTSVVIKDLGLRGATETDYYDPRNSFLNRVLERKLGIPISLSIVYMIVGSRAGIALGGTAMPMHFLVKVLGIQPPLFVDCYNQGRILTVEQCKEGVKTMSRGQIPFRDEMLDIVSNGAVLSRLLTNLKMIYLNALQYAKALPILDRLLVLNPSVNSLLRERGLVRYNLEQFDLARQDLKDYLATESDPPDAQEIRNLLRKIG